MGRIVPMHKFLNILKPNRLHYAAATLVTTVVGIGIFGIPFSFVKAGFVTGLLFLIGLSFVAILRNLLYGEVVLRTSSQHQIIGYVEKYLGANAKRLSLFGFMVGVYGALLAVIVIGGTFWANVFWFFDFSVTTFSIIFFVVASLVVFKGLKTASRLDLILLIFFIAIIVLISFMGLGNIDVENYKSIFFQEFWFLPFGVILFAFAGMSAIPLMKEVLAGENHKFKKAIVIGTVVPAILYIIFAFVIVGVSGEITSPDAISGLAGFLGNRAVIIASLLGFFSTFTVFVNISLALKESFIFDFNIKKRHAQFLVTLPPILLFASGLRNFIEIVGLVGAVSVGLETVLLIFTYLQAKKKGDRDPEYSLKVPHWLLYLLAIIFGAGIVYSLVFF